MKKILFATAMLGISASVSLLNAETYRIHVGEFNELIIDDNVNVVYSELADSVGYVVFDIAPEKASYIMTECTKGKLKVLLDPDAANLETVPTVYAYSSYLSKAKNSKDSTLFIRSVRPGAKIDIELQGNGKIVAHGLDAVTINLKLITGNGTVVASGRCDNLNIDNIGTGTIQADEVIAKEAKCRLMGTGTIGCSPQKKLRLQGLGSGKVYYTGSPQIEKSKLSNIEAIALDSENSEEMPETEMPEAPVAEEPDGNSELLDLIEDPDSTETSVPERLPVRKR